MKLGIAATLAALVLTASLAIAGGGAALADPIADASAGQDALNKGDLNGAVSLFTRAIDSRGLPRAGLESAYVERATAYAGLHKYDLAIADLDLAQQISPDDPDARGLRSQIQGTGALTQADAARRGAALYDRGDYDGALAALDRAVALNPNDAYSLYERGLTWLAKPDYNRALADFNAVLKLQPNTWGALDERGNAYRGKGSYDLAISDYNDAIRLYPNGAAIYFDRGLAHGLKRDTGLAIADFDRALGMQPNVESYLYARCMIRAAAAIELDKALGDCNHAIQINPQSAADIDARGFVRFKRGEFAPAINDTSEAIRRDSRRGSAFYVRGLAELRSNQTAAGLADIRAAQAIDPKVGDYYAKWGIRP
ncbi:MAG TPA: tetratricopeptide repeat protein [Caulobacteraceae bacterium]|nr:tetratricopeptide repeat protein [Caulobacteraceae bacterium]